jgi:flagellar FliJ protein
VRKFTFSLQTALDLRSREEDASRQQLAEARRVAEALARQLHALEARHELVVAMLRGAPSDGAGTSQDLCVDHLANGQEYLRKLRVQMRALRAQLVAAEEVCELRRVELLDASRSKKTLERLAEKRELEHDREELANEQRELDEMAAIAYAGSDALNSGLTPIVSRSTA